MLRYIRTGKSNLLICSSKEVLFTTSFRRYSKIRSLEDLTKLKSLDNIDPEIIRKLIDERTSELNTANELDMLKKFSQEEKSIRDNSLKRFARPTWVVLLMSSTVYMLWQLAWWKLAYDEKEKELEAEVRELEEELAEEQARQRPWYRKLF